MTARSAQSPARWALGALVAVVMSLSVLAHHALTGPTMGPMSRSDAMGPMSHSDAIMSSMAAFASPSAAQGREAKAPHAVGPALASATAATGTCGSQGMCTAAGVAASPLPAALPHATTVAVLAHPSGRVRPLPPGTGPPPPAETTSVLRI